MLVSQTNPVGVRLFTVPYFSVISQMPVVEFGKPPSEQNWGEYKMLMVRCGGGHGDQKR